MRINFRKSPKSYFDFDMNSVKGYWISQNFEPMPKKEEHFSAEYVETPLFFCTGFSNMGISVTEKRLPLYRALTGFLIVTLKLLLWEKLLLLAIFALPKCPSNNGIY